jgi:hypothetical protein
MTKTYKEEVVMSYEILKKLLVSPINLYTKDPELYDEIHKAMETIEYVLYSDND